MKRPKLILAIAIAVIATISIAAFVAAMQGGHPGVAFLSCVVGMGITALAALFFVGLTGRGGGE